MSLININLLPSEFILEEIKKARFSKIQSVGIAILLLVFFLSSLIVSLRILQSQKVKQVENEISGIEQRISSAKTKEDSLVSLKDRLSVIDKYSSTQSKQAMMYSFIEEIIPSGLTVSSLTIDQFGSVYLSLNIPDAEFIDTLINALTDPGQNNNKIKEVSIENLNRGRDGVYRIALRLKAV